MTFTDEEIQRGLLLNEFAVASDGTCLNDSPCDCRDCEYLAWLRENGWELLSELQRLRRIEEISKDLSAFAFHTCDNFTGSGTEQCAVCQYDRAAKEGEA